MEKVILFHGSNKVIAKPIYGYGKEYNDFGLGFYTTENVELAKEWACPVQEDGIVNKYELNLDGLKILDLTSSSYSVLNWLAILLDNRLVNIDSPIAKKGKEYIAKEYLIDYKKYDVIIGYRADDSYFSFVRYFLTNQISIEELKLLMKLGDLGKQIVIKSEKAFDRIEFISSEIVDCVTYFNQRKKRDDLAKKSFKETIENSSGKGKYLRDLIKEGD